MQDLSNSFVLHYLATSECPRVLLGSTWSRMRCFCELGQWKCRDEIATHQNPQFGESCFGLAIPRQNGRSVVTHLKPYAESTRRLWRIPRYKGYGLNGWWWERQEKFSLDPDCSVKPSSRGDSLG